MLVEMAVDSTDPVEPLPQGDADIVETKETYDGRLVLVGNIEFLDMETKDPDKIEALGRRAIEGDGKRNVILVPSAGPHQRPTDLFLRNAERYSDLPDSVVPVCPSRQYTTESTKKHP